MPKKAAGKFDSLQEAVLDIMKNFPDYGYSKIAKELGVTKSSVSSAASRLRSFGLVESRIEKSQKRKRTEELTFKAPPEEILIVLEPEPKQKPVIEEEEEEQFIIEPEITNQSNLHPTIVELKYNSCRWMIDDIHYCGKIATDHIKPYCPEHKEIVYVKMEKKPKKKNEQRDWKREIPYL